MTEHHVVQEFDFSKMVMAIQGKAFTTSQKIADYFGKRHDNVLRKIRQVRDECPEEFAALNFEEADFIDKNGEAQPMFKLTKRWLHAGSDGVYWIGSNAHQGEIHPGV